MNVSHMKRKRKAFWTDGQTQFFLCFIQFIIRHVVHSMCLAQYFDANHAKARCIAYNHLKPTQIFVRMKKKVKFEKCVVFIIIETDVWLQKYTKLTIRMAENGLSHDNFKQEIKNKEMRLFFSITK